MLNHILKMICWRYPSSFFAVFGAFWLIVEPIIGLTGISINLKYWQLVLLSAVVGVIWLIIDGYYISGFLRKSIEIKSNSFDTVITVAFADLFSFDGWKAIAVNDFFDSKVDGLHVSSKSLHGTTLVKYWGGNIDEWDSQVQIQLIECSSENVARRSGKKQRYDIGSTVAINKDGNKLLFVALTHTDIQTLQTKANISDLNRAVRGLLAKARSICAKDPLNIPLMGSGLARVGIKGSILVHLILAAIIEETKINKITDNIRVVLPIEKMSEINLVALKQEWS